MAHSIIGNICKLLCMVFAVVIIVVVFRTLSLDHRTIITNECQPLDEDFIKADDALLKRFTDALKMQTISWGAHDGSYDELLKIQDHIRKSYPNIHSSPLVTLEVINTYSLLYTITGSQAHLKPYMLCGHLDVVPVTEEVWDKLPFAGDIHDGFIYGRGTIDDKHAVFGILEALEFALSEGHQPKRTFYIAFGHDEEVGGVDGAHYIAAALESRGVQLEFLMDEGMTIINGLMPGIDKPVALIGSSEKGSVTLKLSVNVPGGHSSMPHKESCIGILSKAVNKLEANPHPSMLGTGPEKGTFEHLAPYMSLPQRVIMSNIWLFAPLLERFLSMKPSTNAIVRTTTAVTKFNSGIKDNVIAPYAEVIVNHRVHPSQTIDEVVEYDRKIINDDRIKIIVKDFLDPLPKSPYGDEHFGWQMIKASIIQVFGHHGTLVAPSVTIGNTDTRHYLNLTQNMYRFSPTFMFPEDLPRFHGVNERISVENYEDVVNFYYHLMMNADKPSLEPLHKHTEF